MANEEIEGWFTDPFGRHEARWMAGDTPTDLVRDGRVEGHDPVLDEPFSAKPLRIKYVERGDKPDRFLKSKGGVAVPGGIVTIEPHPTSDGDISRAKILLQSVTAIGAASVKRDIVVWDGSHEHQLYRDGPYDSITVNRPLERLIAELNRLGVNDLMSHLRVRKHMLTDGHDWFSVVRMESSESFWEQWDRIRGSSDPDPLEVLRVTAAFSSYFQSAQKEAISFARAAGLSWEQIAESLGQSRQRLWQRASRDESLQALLQAKAKRRWEAIRRDPVAWYENTKDSPS